MSKPSMFIAKTTPGQQAAAPQPEVKEPRKPKPVRRKAAAGEATKRFEDKTQLTVYLSNDAYRQLRVLAAELSTDSNVRMQDLLRLGVDLVFKRYGKPPIAESPEDLNG